LKLLTLRKTVQDIASEIDLSERTVEAIINRIKVKAKVESQVELVKYAEEMDLI
jgi:DNA-binding NarL/FixJ family response regulator